MDANQDVCRKPAAMGSLLSPCGAFVFLLVGCAPVLHGDNQCPDVNYAVAAAKDDSLPSSWPEFDAIMNEHVQRTDVSGCAAAVIRDREVIYVRGYGIAHAPPGDVGVKRHTVFPVGSVAKLFTATALLRLWEKGFIGSLDDPVFDYLTEVALEKPDWGRITLRELLSHTSGLAWDPRFDGPYQGAQSLELVHGEFSTARPTVSMLAVLVGSTEFQPGQFGYSNTAYTLAGAVIERVVQQRGIAAGYEDYVWNYVALHNATQSTQNAATSMCLNTYWRNSGDIPDLSALFDSSGSFAASQNWGPDKKMWGWEGPSGGWSMTVGDLARVGLAIATGERLSQTTIAEMRQPHGFRLGVYDYGLGTYEDSMNSEPAIGHGGEIAGYVADLQVRLDGRFGLAVACNSGPLIREPSDPFQGLYPRLRDVIIGQSVPMQTVEAAVTPEARLFARHGEFLRLAAGALGSSDRSTALEAIAARMPNGQEILAAARSGDYATMARLLTHVLDGLPKSPPLDEPSLISGRLVSTPEDR